MICWTPRAVLVTVVYFEAVGFVKAQEDLMTVVRQSKCESQETAGQRHSDVLRCTFDSVVSNFHVQFYPDDNLSKTVPDVHIVISCASTCEVRETFKNYIFVSPSGFEGLQNNTYTFEVLPSNTTKGSYVCQGFHDSETLITNVCNVSRTRISDQLLYTDSKEDGDGGSENSLYLLFLLLLLAVAVIAVVLVWKISRSRLKRRCQKEESKPEGELLSPLRTAPAWKEIQHNHLPPLLYI